MGFQSWIEGINGLASLYSFDILPDGSFSEIRLMAVNKMNTGMLHMNPNAPEFYPGIPYRNYWMDLNFESFVYKCASTNEPLYSYVNARGVWLKGFYIPIADIENIDINDIDISINPEAALSIENAEEPAEELGENRDALLNSSRKVYCLYIITYSEQVETDFMSHKSTEVANAVMDISIKLHESSDFYESMAATVAEIKEVCSAERCSIYTVNNNNQKCEFIDSNGLRNIDLDEFAAEMNRTPYEVAKAWEEDLALSDCLLLEDLSVIEERDPAWYQSMIKHGIKNIILYAIRNNQTIVGYIWAANYDISKMEKIKEILELSTFLIAAVISNHQLLSFLELRSAVDGLTQAYNRTAMEVAVKKYYSGEKILPKAMGIVFADLNGLKVVNDNEGHEAGDKLLMRAAALLKIAFGDYKVYRIGGDEFVILCPEIEEDRMNEQVEQLRGLSDNTADVSFAIGTMYCTGEYDINSAIQQADENMYKDKEEYYHSHPEKKH